MNCRLVFRLACSRQQKSYYKKNRSRYPEKNLHGGSWLIVGSQQSRDSAPSVPF
jgi:hypothetical protein